jgi:hypothetical protein
VLGRWHLASFDRPGGLEVLFWGQFDR